MTRDPHEPHERRAEFQPAARDEQILAAVNNALTRMRLPARQAAVDVTTLPLIYIVGAPRSGTTLLSQVISRHLAVGYVDNLIARFWMRPAVGIRLSEMVLGPNRRSTIAFSSRHGTTADPAGPHEFGYFWRYWLQLDRAATHHLGVQALSALDLRGLRGVLHDEILGEFQRPTVFKNVICGFQAEWLSKVHPRSIFIHVKRSTAPTVASILQSRLERFGSYQAWWSLKPATFAEIGAIEDPVIQVAEQVRACRREITEELSRPGILSVVLEYEEVCRSPQAMLKRVCASIRELGFPLSPPEAAPQAFVPSGGPSLPAVLAARVRAAVGDP